MAYTTTFSMALGTSKAGLTLAAQIMDTAGVNVGVEIVAGFIEVGGGSYILTTSIPDSQRGVIKVYQSGVPGTIFAIRDINPEEIENADTKTSGITDDVFAEVVEGTVTFRQWIRRSAAVLFGKTSGGGAVGSKKFRDLGDAVNRVDATTDASGNRSSVTFDDA